MANQMIALQSRNPQLPDPARATAQMANMMNMASQQRAAQLQGDRIRQEMEFAKAKEGREVDTQSATIREKDLDYQLKDIKRLRNIGVAVLQSGNEDAYQSWLGMVEKADQQLGTTIRQVAPNFNPEIMQSVLMEADKYIDKTIPNAEARVELADTGGVDAQGNPIPKGTGIQVTTGLKPNTRVIPNAPNATAPAPAAAPQTTTGAVQTGKFGEALVTPDSARPLTPYQQDHIRRMQEELGMTNTPASFNSGGMGTPTAGQMSPDMVPAILDSAVKTGVMAQIDLDQMLAMAPPQAKQGIMDVIRSNKITLQADAPSLAASGMSQQQPTAPNPVQRPQAQFADLRGPAPQSQTAGLRGAPPMEQTLAQYQPLQRRDPNVSPAPSPVAPAILGAQEGAKTSASKNVELQMNPRIAADIKKAERDVEKRAEAPKALSAAKSVVNGLDDYIETIDRLLRSPDRHTIVGRFEGRIPYALQDERQAELQADFDKIKNTDTLTSLVEMKQASPTGGSPVGNASNQDVLLVARGANSLVQTGGVPKFDQELKNIRRQAYRARQTAIEEYNNRYGDLAAGDPRLKLTVRPTADRYISTKDLPQNKSSASGRKTSVIPDGAKQMLRKNPSPQQRAFFDRTFGAGAAAKVLGTR